MAQGLTIWEWSAKPESVTLKPLFLWPSLCKCFYLLHLSISYTILQSLIGTVIEIHFMHCTLLCKTDCYYFAFLFSLHNILSLDQLGVAYENK